MKVQMKITENSRQSVLIVFVVWNLPFKPELASRSCLAGTSHTGLQLFSEPCGPLKAGPRVRSLLGFFVSSSCCSRQFSLKNSCHEPRLALPAAFHTACTCLLGHIILPRPSDGSAKERVFSHTKESAPQSILFPYSSCGARVPWGRTEREYLLSAWRK